LGRQKRGAVDIIQELIKTNNIKTYANWEIKLNMEDKQQLLRDTFTTDTYAARIIKNNKNKKSSLYKYKTYHEIIVEMTKK